MTKIRNERSERNIKTYYRLKSQQSKSSAQSKFDQGKQFRKSVTTNPDKNINLRIVDNQEKASLRINASVSSSSFSCGKENLGDLDKSETGINSLKSINVTFGASKGIFSKVSNAKPPLIPQNSQSNRRGGR